MDKVLKKMLLSVMAVFVLVVFNACSIEAKSLTKGEVYRSNKGGTIEVISGSELEINKGGQITLAKYGFKDDKLRAVFGDTVVYFEITKEGLKDEKTGQVYYSKAALAALEKNVLEELKKSMVFVKGGCYQMGDTFGDGNADEKPVHEVCVDDFYIGKYEVTQKEWNAIMGNNPSEFKGCDSCPVESVSLNDAQEYINKLNSKTGKKYRLPTEAEWEYAARSGGKNEKYAGGNDIDSVAWYYKNSGGKTHPVGQKKPNGLGIYDMSGNVWEWTNDWYDKNYYSSSPKNNPQGANGGQIPVLRGGSWSNVPRDSRAAFRYWGNPDYRSFSRDLVGFRCVLTK